MPNPEAILLSDLAVLLPLQSIATSAQSWELLMKAVGPWAFGPLDRQKRPPGGASVRRLVDRKSFRRVWGSEKQPLLNLRGVSERAWRAFRLWPCHPNLELGSQCGFWMPWHGILMALVYPTPVREPFS